MKPEAQRRAIAEACPGVFRIWEGATTSLYYTPGDNVWILTDLLNDLNAMHEAEKVLGSDEATWHAYRFWLLDTIEPHRHEIHATAAQRAEAFLKTIDKWQPTADASSTERLG